MNGILDFLKDAEQLKNTLRSSKTSNGRSESTAEHTWRLCLMVLLFESHYSKIDILKLIKICIIHDLGEAISGDIPAVDQIESVDKGAKERKDLQQLIEPLPKNLKGEILMLWDEYETAVSEEALLAKAFDKLETILQHVQGKNDLNFNYEFNLLYGKEYTDYDEITSELRALIDKDTRSLVDPVNRI
ncbi:HD domain-containing protein [Microbulbifer sp. 2304DJ12-6]|uniref:HD domain-containing protein n=1 Tax=Microbulbifer sp. 2304DJ12-6 TaxID=3233340 RepID=UPI0039B0310D